MKLSTPLQAFQATSSPSALKRTFAAVKDYAKLCKSQEKPVPAHVQAVAGLDAPALSRAIEKDISSWAQDHFAGLHAAWTDSVQLVAARLQVLRKNPSRDWYSRPEFLLCEAAPSWFPSC